MAPFSIVNKLYMFQTHDHGPFGSYRHCRASNTSEIGKPNFQTQNDEYDAAETSRKVTSAGTNRPERTAYTMPHLVTSVHVYEYGLRWIARCSTLRKVSCELSAITEVESKQYTMFYA